MYNFSILFVFAQILHSSVTGHSASSLTRSSKSLADFMQDLENDIIDSPVSSPRQSGQDLGVEMVEEPTDQVFETPRKPETDIVKLAARTVSWVHGLTFYSLVIAGNNSESVVGFFFFFFITR